MNVFIALLVITEQEHKAVPGSNISNTNQELTVEHGEP